MKVFILGAGKVGRTFTRVLRAAGHDVTLRASRRRLPTRPIEADVAVLTVRDPVITKTAAAMAEGGLVPKSLSVLHVSGALGPEALGPLAKIAAGVAQAHPLVSFASSNAPPDLTGGLLWIRGDAKAVRRARGLGRALGMVPRVLPDIDPTLYHSAAALLANGGVALADGAAELMRQAGMPHDDIPGALGVLLRSVAGNLERLGLPDALTGPIRRGDAITVAGHLDAIASQTPDLLPLYLACARAQLQLSRRLRDASPGELAEIEAILGRRRAKKRRRRTS